MADNAPPDIRDISERGFLEAFDDTLAIGRNFLVEGTPNPQKAWEVVADWTAQEMSDAATNWESEFADGPDALWPTANELAAWWVFTYNNDWMEAK